MAKFMVLIPQKARGKLREEMWSSPEWTAEEKLDGERRIAQFCGPVVRFTGTPSKVFGKPVEKTAQIPHLSDLWPKDLAVNEGQIGTYRTTPPYFMDGTVLDGELIATEGMKLEGGQSKYVTAIANSKPAEAIRKQIEQGWLRYRVFDCLFWRGLDIRHLSLIDRRARATKAVKEWNNPWVQMVDWSAARRAFLDTIIKRGGEGVVLKHNDHRYGEHLGWVKVKAEATYDCVIIGYKDAKATSKKTDGKVSATKYAEKGLIGALIIGQALRGQSPRPHFRLVGTISGMDDGLRARFTKDKEKYLGAVVEIKANGREPTGRFRHPRFVRLRTDKRAIDCIYDQDES